MSWEIAPHVDLRKLRRAQPQQHGAIVAITPITMEKIQVLMHARVISSLDFELHHLCSRAYEAAPLSDDPNA